MPSVPRTLLSMQQVLDKYLLEKRMNEGTFKVELIKACAYTGEASRILKKGCWRCEPGSHGQMG